MPIVPTRNDAPGASIPGCAAYGSLALAARVGSIERFPRPASLANYWGLTPGCRNSGEATDRLGSITKQGSAMARFILGQLVMHVLRRDPWMKAWYGRIKRRRGAKIARVAVMRRLATVIWHMVKNNEPYVAGGVIFPSARAWQQGVQQRNVETKEQRLHWPFLTEEALACKASLISPVDFGDIARA